MGPISGAEILVTEDGRTSRRIRKSQDISMENETVCLFSSFYLPVEDAILLKKWTKFIRFYFCRTLLNGIFFLVS